MINIDDNINNGPQMATQEKQIQIKIGTNSVANVGQAFPVPLVAVVVSLIIQAADRS